MPATVAAAPPGSAAPRRTLLVIGGAEDKRGRSLVLRRFVRLAGGRRSRIVIVPTASSFDAEAVQTYTAVFQRLRAGDAISAVNPSSRQDAFDPELVARLDDATGIFMTGGNQLKLTQHIVGTPVGEAIVRAYHRGAVIAGTSAGASAMSRFMISMGDEGLTPRQRASQLSSGLGLLEHVVVDQHFDQRARYGRLLSIVATSLDLIGIGIDENTAAEIVDERRLTVLGAGAVFVIDGRRAVTDAPEARRGAPLLVSGAVVHSLPAGASFDLADAALVGFVEHHLDVGVVVGGTHDRSAADLGRLASDTGMTPSPG